MAQHSGKKKSSSSKAAPKGAVAKPAPPSANALTIADIKALFAMMKDNEIAELNLEQKDTKIHIVSTHAPQVMPPTQMHQMMPMVMGMPGSSAPAPVPATMTAEPATAPEKPAAPAGPETPSNLKTVHSPMVGTFYRSPAPEASPFVQVGDNVSEETTLCIIEAMKLMNEIKAEVKGRIHKILVENGVPVEYNQPLFLVEP